MPAAVGFENEGLGTRIRINRRCHTETVQHLRYYRTVMPGMAWHDAYKCSGGVPIHFDHWEGKKQETQKVNQLFLYRHIINP